MVCHQSRNVAYKRSKTGKNLQMNKYEQYKPSGVEWLGEVPEHWEVTKIKYIAELTPSKSEIIEFEKECSFVPMEKLKLGSLTLDESRIIGDVINSYTYFKNGDLLIAKVTPCFENKNFSVAENLINGIGFGSSEIYVLRPQHCNVRYLFYRLQENAFMELATGAMTGAGGLKRIPSDFLNNFSLAMPPEPEQTTIATYLDERTAYIDRLIAKQQALSEKLSEKRTALITEAVCGRVKISHCTEICFKDSGIQWLGEIPEHWEVKPSKCFLSFVASGKTPKGGAEVYVNEGIMLIRSQNVYDDGLRLNDVVFITEEADLAQRSSRVLADDVLLNITGASLGRVSIVPKDIPLANVNQHVCILRPIQSVITPKFLHYLFQSAYTKAIIQAGENGTSREGLTFEQIKSMKFALPNTEEQTAITTHLDKETAKIDRLQAKIGESVERLKEYRAALITQVVTGKVKV